MIRTCQCHPLLHFHWSFSLDLVGLLAFNLINSPWCPGCPRHVLSVGAKKKEKKKKGKNFECLCVSGGRGGTSTRRSGGERHSSVKQQSHFQRSEATTTSAATRSQEPQSQNNHHFVDETPSLLPAALETRAVGRVLAELASS